MRLVLVLVSLVLGLAPANAQEFEVLPPEPAARGQLWIGEGASFVEAENRAVENRFRLGLDYQFGQQLRFQLGLTAIDVMSGGESSAAVGSISRSGTGVNAGYFLIPQKLVLLYTFLFEGVSGSRISDGVTTLAHQIALGYRFYSNDTVHFGVNLSYLYAPSVTVPIYDLPSQSYSNVTFPSAQVLSVGFTAGVYFF